MRLVTSISDAFANLLHVQKQSEESRELEEDIDIALRVAMRSGVAGAAPPLDSWRSLQRRMAENEARLSSGMLPRSPALRPIPSPLPFSIALFSRFSQLGVAMLMLLLVIGGLTGVTGVENMSRSSSQTQAQVSDGGGSSALNSMSRQQIEALHDLRAGNSTIGDSAVTTPEIGRAYDAPDPLPRPSQQAPLAAGQDGKTAPVRADTPN